MRFREDVQVEGVRLRLTLDKGRQETIQIPSSEARICGLLLRTLGMQSTEKVPVEREVDEVRKGGRHLRLGGLVDALPEDPSLPSDREVRQVVACEREAEVDIDGGLGLVEDALDEPGRPERLPRRGHGPDRGLLLHDVQRRPDIICEDDGLPKEEDLLVEPKGVQQPSETLPGRDALENVSSDARARSSVLLEGPLGTRGRVCANNLLLIPGATLKDDREEFGPVHRMQAVGRTVAATVAP